MGIIWLIEEPTTIAASQALATTLAGNFPVRLFASLRSLRAICQVEKPALPALLVINGGSLSVDADTLPDHLPIGLQQVPRLWVDVEAQANQNNADLVLIQRIRDELVRGKQRKAEEVSEQGMVYCYKGLRLDMEKHTIQCDDQSPCGVTGKEARLLRQLMVNQGRCVSREELQAKVWSDVVVSPRTIDSHISRLRRHLELSGIEIQNVYGSGYSLR